MEMAGFEVSDDKEIAGKLKASMRNHLKELSAKDYQEAVRANLKKLNHEQEVKHISCIMFLPSEACLEKLQLIDKEFMQKAWEIDIFPAGPIGLINILAHAKFTISEERQGQNHKIITEEVRKLLASIATIYEYIKRVGGGIQSAASNYDKLAGSFNSSILPKARNLQKLGINMQQNKTLPSSLERYQIVSTSNSLIDAEACEENDKILEIAE
jgi:DNA recombination protein RmuC